MFRRDAPREMTTREYADYITALTGIKKSPESVAYDCRTGKLKCRRDGDKGEWRIIVSNGYVPIAEYNKLEVECEKLRAALNSIRKLAEC